MGSVRQSEPLRSGLRAPDFTLARLDSAAPGNADLGTLLSGGPVLLAFFKSTCPVCQMTLSQDDPETTKEFAGEFGISFPMLLDTEESGYPASNAYGLSHVPTLFLVERDGTIVWSLEGFNKKEFLAVAGRVGVYPFRPGENVPEWKAG
jgi:peroxiredoxin